MQSAVVLCLCVCVNVHTRWKEGIVPTIPSMEGSARGDRLPWKSGMTWRCEVRKEGWGRWQDASARVRSISS